MANTGYPSGAKSDKEDIFSRLVAYGSSYQAAYKQAGYVGKHKDQPRKLAAKCKKPIAYYRNERGKNINVTEEQILFQLASIAFNDIGNFIDTEGNPLRPDELPLSSRLAVSDFKVVKMGEDITQYEYKFEKKLPAITQLAAMKQNLTEQKSGGKRLQVKVNQAKSLKKPEKKEGEE